MASEPFQLVYASLVSAPDQDFAEFHANAVARHLAACGYDPRRFVAQFNVVTTGPARTANYLDFELAAEQVLGSGFTVDQALGLIAANVEPEIAAPRKPAYSGYCTDEALGTRIRLSIWAYATVPASGTH